LSNNLEEFLCNLKHLVVIGMGNELRGDDAVGLEIVRRLKKYEGATLSLFEGHMTPEAFIPSVCQLHPSHLLIADAAELHQRPGSWRLLSKNEIETGLFTTHSLPATIVADETHRRCHTQIAFLGMQPKTRDISLSRSKECLAAVEEIVSKLTKILQSIS
jgi:hydrogenase 3 maturation protease